MNLRPLLEAGGDCPYFPFNMHWTAAGHQRVARYVAEVVLPTVAPLEKPHDQ